MKLCIGMSLCWYLLWKSGSHYPGGLLIGWLALPRQVYNEMPVINYS